ncbi:hypothetical protein HanLR1_Chr02g0052101 [Helianthus annuus]|nr:hypothetical protein HanLR1_Chr02g0052101 [Helianthus annuus]
MSKILVYKAKCFVLVKCEEVTCILLFAKQHNGKCVTKQNHNISCVGPNLNKTVK